MKKGLILILLIFLIGCNSKPKGLKGFEQVDIILENRANGQYQEAVVYDLREGQACFDGHIKGFTCIFYQTDLSVDDVFNNINKVYSKKALVLLICEDGEISKALANRLSEVGYQKVYYFHGGYLEYCQQNANYIPEIGCDC